MDIEEIEKMLSGIGTNTNDEVVLGILQVYMLLHIYHKLESIDDGIASLVSDSWSEHHDRPKGWMP